MTRLIDWCTTFALYAGPDRLATIAIGLIIISAMLTNVIL